MLSLLDEFLSLKADLLLIIKHISLHPETWEVINLEFLETNILQVYIQHLLQS